MKNQSHYITKFQNNHSIILFKSLLLILLPTIIFSSNIRLTEGLESCQYTLSDGSKLDLRHLRRNYDYIFQMNRYTYKANFCGALEDKCPGSMAPAAVFIRSSICLYKLTTSWTDTKMEYIDPINPSTGVKITLPPGDKCYFGGGSYTVSYLLFCDLIHDIDFDTIIKSQTCNFEYHFRTKYACPQAFIKSEVFGSKSILLGLIFIISFYCIGFSFLNYRSNPEDGLMKAMPHREFWMEFFDNALHGVKVIVRYAKNKIKGRDEYNSY